MPQDESEPRDECGDHWGKSCLHGVGKKAVTMSRGWAEAEPVRSSRFPLTHAFFNILGTL